MTKPHENLWILCALLSLALSASVLADKPKARKTTVIVINNAKKTAKKAKKKTTVVIVNGKKKAAVKAKKKTTVVIVNGKKKAAVKAKKKTTVVIVSGNKKAANLAKKKTTVVIVGNKPAKRAPKSGATTIVVGKKKPTNVVVPGGSKRSAGAVTGGPLPLCSLRVCALYKTTARGKVSWKCGLKKYRGNCSCVKTDVTCGKNWRGKYKHFFQCSCRPICEQSICARYKAVAKTKSSVKCGWKKGYSYKRCKCEQGPICAKNWRGANKYSFQCKCK